MRFKKELRRYISSLLILLILAIILSGLLAGADVDRYIVHVPAWRHLDIRTWAEFSKHADLGNGLFLYPVEAIGSFVLLAIASFIMTFRKQLKYIAIPVHVVAILSAIGLIFTFLAAPIMLSLKTIGNDPAVLQHAFDKFHY